MCHSAGRRHGLKPSQILHRASTGKYPGESARELKGNIESGTRHKCEGLLRPKSSWRYVWPDHPLSLVLMVEKAGLSGAVCIGEYIVIHLPTPLHKTGCLVGWSGVFRRPSREYSFLLSFFSSFLSFLRDTAIPTHFGCLSRYRTILRVCRRQSRVTLDPGGGLGGVQSEDRETQLCAISASDQIITALVRPGQNSDVQWAKVVAS